jgi:hypothetical protein
VARVGGWEGETAKLQLSSLLDTVCFFSCFPSPICALPEARRLDQRASESEAEADREAESARARLLDHLVCVPAVPLSALGGGVGGKKDDKRESCLDPCSLLIVVLDSSTSDTNTHNTHTHTLRAHKQITSAAAMHKDNGLALRLIDVALALHAIG